MPVLAATAAIEATPVPVAVGPPADLRIESLVCPTRSRVEALWRCLSSYAATLADHGRRVEIVASDDSRHPEARAANAQVLRRIGAEYGMPVRYAGLEHKLRFARHLIAHGCEPDLVQFALFDPERTEFTVGANRNAILLDTVGRAVFSVDDDTVCRIARSPGASSAPAWLSERRHSSSSPYDVRVFPDRGAALSALAFEPIDPLRAHEEYLGRRVAGRGTIAATVNGLVGDCTWLTPALYLFLTGSSLDDVIASDERYLAACTTREHIHLVRQPLLSACMENAPTSFVGLDNRRGLCPFVPIGRGEDILLWLVLSKVSARHCFAHLPYVMLHSPLDARRFAMSDSTRGATASELHWILGLLIRDFDAPTADVTADAAEGAPATAPLAPLGDYLVRLASIPTAAFVDLIRERTTAEALRVADALDAGIGARPTAAPAWRRHASACAALLRRATEAGTLVTPVDLSLGRTVAETQRLTQRIVLRYGRLLREWPRMVDAARELSHRGIRVSRDAA